MKVDLNKTEANTSNEEIESYRDFVTHKLKSEETSATVWSFRYFIIMGIIYFIAYKCEYFNNIQWLTSATTTLKNVSQSDWITAASIIIPVIMGFSLCFRGTNQPKIQYKQYVMLLGV